MKIKTLVALFLTGLVLLLGACNGAETTTDTSTPSNNVPPAPNKYLVVITSDDFAQSPDIVRQAEVKAGDTFTISIDSNATTGFSWTEQAVVSNANILTQTGHQYIAPPEGDTPVAGVPGSEEWTFKANQTGTVKINLSYDRPWEGGEKGVRTFELTVVVK